MTNLQPIIDDLLNVRDQLKAVPLDHRWDRKARDNTIPRLDAALSDLRVVACRMREDQPRVTYDPATDQAVAVDKPSPVDDDALIQWITEDPAKTEPDPQPITEAAMRAAQVGWVAVAANGEIGHVAHTDDKHLRVRVHGVVFRHYEHAMRGHLGRGADYAGYRIVSLSPPDVVADVEEVLK